MNSSSSSSSSSPYASRRNGVDVEHGAGNHHSSSSSLGDSLSTGLPIVIQTRRSPKENLLNFKSPPQPRRTLMAHQYHLVTQQQLQQQQVANGSVGGVRGTEAGEVLSRLGLSIDEDDQEGKYDEELEMDEENSVVTSSKASIEEQRRAAEGGGGGGVDGRSAPMRIHQLHRQTVVLEVSSGSEDGGSTVSSYGDSWIADESLSEKKSAFSSWFGF